MKYKILIIEDDSTIQTQLRNLLTGNGYEVETVTDFRNTVEHVKTFAPHLVLLDIKLPGSSGFEICSQIRAGTPSSQSLTTRQSCWPKSLPCCGKQALPLRQLRS